MTTFLIIIAFSLVNLTINGCIYFSSRRKEYLKLSAFWLALIVNFFVQSKAQGSLEAIIYGYGFSLLPLSLLAYSSISFTNSRYPWRILTPTAPISFLITYAIIDWPISFTLKALPFSIALSIPLIYTLYIYLLKPTTKKTPLMKFHAIVIFFITIHTFNFAFFRMEPKAQLWGWPVAYALYQLLAGVLPALTIDFFHREEEDRLKDIIHQRTEELQEANKDLEKLVSQKQYLFRTLTHDISTPLSIARMKISLFEQNPHDIEAFVRKMSDLTLRMEQLISQVRNFESIQAGVKKFPLRKENLLRCVTQVEQMFEDRLNEKNIKFVFDNSELQQYEVNVDPQSFVNSVLMNLISNSIKFCQPGGQIKINSRLDDQGFIILSIEDDGIGMPEHIRQNLFDFEAKTSRKGTCDEPGTGFGVPIVKKIIQAYGGDITVNSKEKKDGGESYTRFDIRLEGQIHDQSHVA